MKEMSERRRNVIIIVGVCMAIVLVLALQSGCANLKGKGVVTSGSVQGFKLITTVDPNTGSMAPQIETGFGDFMFADCPTDSDVFFEYFTQEKSLWTNVAGSTKYIRISGGKGIWATPAVKMLMEPLKEQPLEKKATMP
jgi:hypothetical protein